MISPAELVDQLATIPQGTPDAFEPGDVADLPEPARRWLTFAIAPGTPLYQRARLRMNGTIRLDRWRPFTAVQELAPDRGFVWAANTHIAHLPVRGYDALVDGAGSQHWRMIRAITVQSASGPEVTRSAADRLAAECTLLPTSLVPTGSTAVSWQPGPARDSAIFTREVGGSGRLVRVTVRVRPNGGLQQVTMSRWGQPAGTPFGQYGFRVDLGGEYRSGGLTGPSEISAAWLLPVGRWQEFFRAHIDSATFD